MEPQDVELFQLLAADPQARRDMEAHGLRLGSKHPALAQTSALKEEINGAVKPFQEKIAELEKALKEKTSADLLEARRASVKKAPFHFTDEQVTELEGRMMKDGNMYSSYEEAARYYQYQDSPQHPTSTGFSPFSRRAPQSEDWRSMMSDPKFVKDKKARHKILKDKWDEASKGLAGSR